MRQVGGNQIDGGDQPETPSVDATVLEYVCQSDAYRNRLTRELTGPCKIKCAQESLLTRSALTDALDELNGSGITKTLKTIELKRAQDELFTADKIARLRSGARGFDARKFLRAQEKATEDARLALEALSVDTDSGSLEDDTTKALDMQSGLQAELDMLPVRDVEAKAKRILAGLGFTDTRLDSKVSTLSGGWHMRCQLAAALLQTADVLILDEPTNFLDMLGMLWLQRYLEDLRDTSPDTAIVLVSHDRDFVNTTCDELMILREKRLSYFQGNLESYEKSMRHEIVRMSRMKEAQDRQIAHMSKTIANSVQQGKKTGDDNKLRQAKSRQKKLDDRMGMEVNSKGGRFKLNRDLAGYHDNKRDAIEVPKDEEVVSLRFPSAPEMRFQSSLISLEGVSYRYPRTVKPALQDVNITVHPGDRIGLLGLNGAGKTTLVQLLTGTRIPTTGTLQAYPRLKVGFYSQHTVDDLAKRGSADTNLTALSMLLLETSEKSITLEEQDARKLLAGTGLVGRTVSDTPVVKLSGGQLVRLALCLLFLDPPHVFILDEPSTHLDLATVSALARALQEYEGAVVLVSHDRFMIRTIVEGEPIDADGSEDEESDDRTGNDDEHRRRIVYEVKAGKVKQLNGGIAAWETTLEKKLTKAGLI
jgi:ATPase subunit of ABC transporter with duplicated ATPase domains